MQIFKNTSGIKDEIPKFYKNTLQNICLAVPEQPTKINELTEKQQLFINRKPHNQNKLIRYSIIKKTIPFCSFKGLL